MENVPIDYATKQSWTLIGNFGNIQYWLLLHAASAQLQQQLHRIHLTTTIMQLVDAEPVGNLGNHILGELGSPENLPSVDLASTLHEMNTCRQPL